MWWCLNHTITRAIQHKLHILHWNPPVHHYREREREANVVERQRCKYTCKYIYRERYSPRRPTTLTGPATHPSGYISTYSYSGYIIMFDQPGIACPSVTTSTKTTGKTSSTSAKSCAVLMACVINGKLVEPLESSISQRPSWKTIRNLNNPKDGKRWRRFKILTIWWRKLQKGNLLKVEDHQKSRLLDVITV